jgi:hypothetical protein
MPNLAAFVRSQAGQKERYVLVGDSGLMIEAKRHMSMYNRIIDGVGV